MKPWKTSVPMAGMGLRPWGVLLTAAAVLLVMDPARLLASAMDPEAAKAMLAGGPQKMDWGQMAMELFGGLALFLFGMEQMTDSLKAIAGNRMKAILGKLTTNRVAGVFTGAFLTAIIQSSSVTTVLTVGFVSAGLISLTQSIGIIFGAEIGTTITAQIIAFKVTKYSMVMITAGFLMSFLGRSERTRGLGKVILGLGLVFFGMTVMSTAMKPLRTYTPFLDMMKGIENPLVGIALTAFFTALVQSSSATTAIVIVMASQGFITLQAGIALAFGANIGTCVTALLASIGKPRDAVRAALVHITFNTSGVMIWVWFIPWIADVVAAISPVAEGVTGVAKLAAETPRQIANAHTLFNTMNTCMFLPFVPLFARFVTWLVPDKPKKGPSVVDGVLTTRHQLDKEVLETPALGLSLVRVKIIQRMGVPVKEMFRDVVPAILHGTEEELLAIRERDQDVNAYYDRILYYLQQIGAQHTIKAQVREFNTLTSVANDLEDLGDAIKLNMVHLGLERIKQGVAFDSACEACIMKFHQEVLDGLHDCIRVIGAQDQEAMERLRNRLPKIQEYSQESLERTANNLVSNGLNLAPYRMEMELYDKFRWVYFRTKRIAFEAMNMRHDELPEEPGGVIFPGHGSQTT